MSAVNGLAEFSSAWTKVWLRLLHSDDRDITKKTLKGSEKALMQLETGAFFVSLATLVTKEPLPVNRKAVVESWIEAELSGVGKTMNDLRNNPAAYANAHKRVAKTIDTLTGHLKMHGLIKINAGNTYALTVVGQEAFTELGG